MYGLNVDGKMTDKTRKKLQEVHNMYSRVSTGKELTALASNSNLGLDYIEKQNLAKIWTFLRVGMGFTKIKQLEFVEIFIMNLNSHLIMHRSKRGKI